MFHETSDDPKKKSKCYRLEMAALLSKAAILMAKETRYSGLTQKYTRLFGGEHQASLRPGSQESEKVAQRTRKYRREERAGEARLYAYSRRLT